MDRSANPSFGAWLKRRRNSLGLTQEQLARQLNCSTILLRKIEAEERRPSLQLIEGLAILLNIPRSERERFHNFARGQPDSFIKEPGEKFPWQANTALPRSNLPAAITSFIGREQEMSDLREYVLNPNVRLITLLGPPGIGKTRLGLEVTRGSLSDFAEGVFFVLLAPLERSTQIPAAIFRSLGYVESKNQLTVEQLLESIGSKQILLMLDNLEHLVEGSALLASQLLSACPHLKIIATSREALRVPGEWAYSVPALNFPKETILFNSKDLSRYPALTLFAERARAVRSGFSLTSENVQTVASLCKQLDGVPLAIELIASRIRFLSPQRLLAQLDEQFILSADGIRAVSARQKTLRNAIQWSYGLLPGEEQELMMHLSVFSGGFTMDAAKAILADDSSRRSISDRIGSLLDKSLLQRSADEDNNSRLNMLTMIHDFALEQLRKTGRESIIRDHHLAYFLTLAEVAEKEIHGRNQVAWMDQIEADHDNIQKALDWAITNQQTEVAVRLLTALAWTWWIRGHYSELHGWLEKVRTLPRLSDHPEKYARLLNLVAAQYSEGNENHKALSLLKDSERIWLTLGKDGEQGLADCLNWMGLVISYADGSMDDAMALVQQSLTFHRKHNNPWGCAHSLFYAGDIQSRMDRSGSPRSYFEQSLVLFDKEGDVWGRSQAYQSLGRMYLDLEDYVNARACFEEMMHLIYELRYMPGIVGGLRDLGNLHFVQGWEEDAERYYEESLAICRQHGMKTDQYYSLFYLSMLALYQKDFGLASQRLLEMHKATIASTTLREARDLIWGFAAVAGGTGLFERSAKLMGAGQAILESTGHQFPPFFRGIFDRYIQNAKEQLGSEKFETLAAEGKGMTNEQAIAYALSIDL